jgi:hypothetical protein
VRLKITRRLPGSIDGLQLAHFEPGETYDVGTSMGSYLLAVGAAEPIIDEAPARIIPMRTNSTSKKSSHRQAPAKAADRSIRRR